MAALLLLLLLLLLLVGVLPQIPSLTCIGTLILEISLQEFFNRPTMWESI